MRSQASEAVNFLRSRQGKTDLRYWFSIVSYDPEEKSLSNQAYLLYLIVFFAIWFFLVLIFIARGFFVLFQLFEPFPATSAMVLLLGLIFAIFSLYLFIKNAHRSPLVFDEEHRYLLCQQAISPRIIVFRWWQQPWLYNLIVFTLLALILGFTLGEATFPAGEMSQYFFVYLWYGFRVVLVSLPFHLAIFIASWANGLSALRNRGKFKAILPTVGIVLLVVFVLLMVFVPAFSGNFPNFLTPISNILLSAFGAGSYGLFTSFLIGLFALGLSFLWLFFASKDFSPSKAAFETEIAAKISAFARYGQQDAINALRQKQRLGIKRQSHFEPNWQGEKAFLWKAWIHYKRSFTLERAWQIFLSFSFVLVLNLSGNSPSGWFVLVSLLWLLRETVLEIFSEDLTLWQLILQLPLESSKWALASLFIPTLPIFLAILLAQILSLVVFPAANWAFILTLQLAFSAAILQLAQDLLRKNRSALLVSGSLRMYGMRGMLMAILCLIFPQIALNIPVSPTTWITGIVLATLILFGSFSGFKREFRKLKEGKQVSG